MTNQFRWAVLTGAIAAAAGCAEGGAPEVRCPAVSAAAVATTALATSAPASQADAVPAFAFPRAPVGPPLWQVPTEVAFQGPPLPEDTQQGIALYQPYLDQYSWQLFMAVNWPACTPGSKDAACAPGEPDRRQWIGGSANGDAPTVWEQWSNADEVFLPGGAAPLPWGSRDVPPACKEEAKGKPVFTPADHSFTAHNLTNVPVAESESGPVIDQKGRWTRVETYLNKATYDYVVKNTLYSKAGQEIFAKRPIDSEVAFSPVYTPPPEKFVDVPVTIELKAVWRVLDEAEQKARRYHTAQALYVDRAGKCQPMVVGLASMHLSAKLGRNPTRVWATFEHADNLCREQYKQDYTGYEYVSGAFCNSRCRLEPSTPGCTPNKLPPKPWRAPEPPTAAGKDPPTQVVRDKPLPLGSIQINSLMATFLASISPNSVWANYQLVGTQWVMPIIPNVNNGIYRQAIPDSAPAPQYIPRIEGEKRCNMNSYLLGNDPKCLGLIVPTILANTLVETYNQPASSCTGCHQTAKTAAGKSADFSFALSRAQ